MINWFDELVKCKTILNYSYLSFVGNSTCPPPWKKIANSKWYLFAEDKRASFAAAKSYCKERGGYIVDITSESEYITLSIKLGMFEPKLETFKRLHYIFGFQITLTNINFYHL